MGSCAAPSAKGDDKFITTDYLQQCRQFAVSSEGLPQAKGSFPRSVPVPFAQGPQKNFGTVAKLAMRQ
ncbi:TPA: hypothetical protein MH287_27105 [Klebsiella pneumoniae]|nr:hypothetical protein [Klebsiella pneumoniae]